MDVIVNVNVDVPDGDEPRVVVKKNKGPARSKGGIIQFPQMNTNNNPILDMMGIKET
jgi:hypothetical protein